MLFHSAVVRKSLFLKYVYFILKCSNQGSSLALVSWNALYKLDKNVNNKLKKKSILTSYKTKHKWEHFWLFGCFQTSLNKILWFLISLELIHCYNWKWNSLCEYIGLVWHQITKNNGTIVKVLWLEETIINNARINSNLRGHPTIEGAATRLLSILAQKC